MWLFVFFFKQKTAYEMRISDWSSDVCSSDLGGLVVGKDDVFRQEADRCAVVLDISMAVLLADVDTEAVAGILAVREQVRGFLRGPVVGGKEGAIDAGDVPFGEVARGHRQFARGVEPAGRGGLFGAHRAERVAMIADRIALADREILVRSDEHTSELQSLMRISYAVCCLKKKKQNYNTQ